MASGRCHSIVRARAAGHPASLGAIALNASSSELPCALLWASLSADALTCPTAPDRGRTGNATAGNTAAGNTAAGNTAADNTAAGNTARVLGRIMLVAQWSSRDFVVGRPARNVDVGIDLVILALQMGDGPTGADGDACC